MKRLKRTLIFQARRFYFKSDFPKNEIKRHVLSYQIMFLSFLAALLFTFVDLVVGKELNILVDLISLIGLSTCMILLYCGKNSVAKVLGFLIVGICLVIDGSYEGEVAGNQYLFFPMISSVLVFFSLSEKKEMIFCLLWIMACITFLELTDYSLIKSETLNIERLKINSIICMLVSAVIIFLNSYFLIVANSAILKKLKKTNIALKKSNSELLKSNSELDSFVYKASHDLRSPLVSILGLIEISKTEQDFEKVKKYLLLKEKSVKKLDGLIIDILDLSKNARLEIVAEKINFRDLFDEIFESYSYVEGFEQIQKSVSITQEVEYFSDLRRLKMIFNNLISNSIRYADLSKSEPQIKVEVIISEFFAQINIWDNGEGIKEEHFKTIFNMYFRANENKAGSGLGLYIVKETLFKLKGKIEINSVHGEWTQFKLLIPNKRKA